MPKTADSALWRSPLDADQLKRKARFWQQIRAFFADLGYTEVSTPVLARYSVSDPAIHSIRAQANGETLWLQTSPEYFMKRLLASGSGPIYQLAAVFRDEEQGKYHRHEFQMLEWYRPGFNYQQLMQEVTELLALWTQAPIQTRRYEDLFHEFLGLHPLDSSMAELRTACAGLEAHTLDLLDRDGLLDYLMAFEIAPRFPKNQFCFVVDYPASQAALAQLCSDPRWAERFELYYGELELANGFSELTDAGIQAQRFAQDNLKRSASGLPEMPIDPEFLQALEHGLPATAGVAMGLDRLLMVLWQKPHIDEVAGFRV